MPLVQVIYRKLVYWIIFRFQLIKVVILYYSMLFLHTLHHHKFNKGW